MALTDECLAHCIKITDELIESPCAHFFRYPVDPVADDLPNYTTVVPHAMDLSLVRARLEGGFYRRVSEWLRDVELIWSNAEDYNGPDSFVTVCARTMRAKFEKLSLSISGDCGSWLAKIHDLQSKIEELTAKPPPLLKGKMKGRRAEPGEADAKRIRSAVEGLKNKEDVFHVFQILRAAGVYVERDRGEAVVRTGDVAPCVAMRVASLLREKNAQQ